jgi:hypothetical protein
VLPDAGGVVHAGQVEGRVLVAPVEGLNAPCHGRMNYKDTQPYMSAFLLNWPVNRLCGMCLTDFIDWRYTHSWLVFSTQLVNCSPHGQRNCVLLPPYLLSDRPPPRPNVFVPYLLVVGGGGGVGGGLLSCVVDYILQEFNTLLLTRFRTYKIATPPQTKMTSKDDI